jgi:murein DD-endopeptidase MepM/ murein hydrolase activator NlpD
VVAEKKSVMGYLQESLSESEDENPKNLLSRLFPVRQVIFRTSGQVSYLRLSRNIQIALATVAFLAVSWTTYVSVDYMRHDAVIAQKNQKMDNARTAYRNLVQEIADYQKSLIKLTNNLEKNSRTTLELAAKMTLPEGKGSSSKKENKKDAKAAPSTTQNGIERQVKEIENGIFSLSKRRFSLEGNIDKVAANLQTALNERNTALLEGEQMSQRIENLETRLKNLQETEEETIDRLVKQASAHIEGMEKVIQWTGMNVDRLLAANNRGFLKGQGGPFIQLNNEDLPGGKLKNDLDNLENHLARSEALQEVMHKLPLSAPMKSFYITSGYGKRRDPINKRWGAHYGLDLGGPFNSSVYVVSPGVVTFSGWKGKYGRMVEIDHGAGIKTRYGHLNKVLVKKGETVKYADKIGLLGNSGRSTGAHLHYEVLFKGKNMNPINFLKAGNRVYQN